MLFVIINYNKAHGHIQNGICIIAAISWVPSLITQFSRPLYTNRLLKDITYCTACMDVQKSLSWLHYFNYLCTKFNNMQLPNDCQQYEQETIRRKCLIDYLFYILTNKAFILKQQNFFIPIKYKASGTEPKAGSISQSCYRILKKPRKHPTFQP